MRIYPVRRIKERMNKRKTNEQIKGRNIKKRTINRNKQKRMQNLKNDRKENSRINKKPKDDKKGNSQTKSHQIKVHSSHEKSQFDGFSKFRGVRKAWWKRGEEKLESRGEERKEKKKEKYLMAKRWIQWFSWGDRGRSEIHWRTRHHCTVVWN